MNKYLVYFALITTLLMGCSKKEESLAPIDIDRTTSCSLDGMILMDYPGPKAQIHYDSGEPDFFCDTMEMFSIYLRPEQRKKVTAIYTQDMGKAPWDQPTGNWIDAKSAYYVHGSKKLGAMGPTFAAFARNEDAEAFAKQFGGQVYRFDQITLDMATLDGGATHDERM